jgi:hypothetical protein
VKEQLFMKIKVMASMLLLVLEVRTVYAKLLRTSYYTACNMLDSVKRLATSSLEEFVERVVLEPKHAMIETRVTTKSLMYLCLGCRRGSCCLLWARSEDWSRVSA